MLTYIISLASNGKVVFYAAAETPEDAKEIAWEWGVVSRDNPLVAEEGTLKLIAPIRRDGCRICRRPYLTTNPTTTEPCGDCRSTWHL